jgi:hypothetical protein
LIGDRRFLKKELAMEGTEGEEETTCRCNTWTAVETVQVVGLT